MTKNTKLTYLHCVYSKLSSLNITKNAKLKELYCFNNQLISLDISKNAELKELHCYSNYIKNTSALTSWLGKSGHKGKVLPQKYLAPSISGGVSSVALKVGYKATSKNFTIKGAPAPKVTLSVPKGAQGKISITQAGKLTIATGLKAGTYTVTIKAANYGASATKKVTITIKK